ncbi:MAG: hypothetical protein SFW67_25265 [Myxococcaceae bacterium]|nr:hypothetical protein [Myxococcaceae bacterium]
MFLAVLFASILGQFDAERLASIEREQAKETAAVQAKYGNKKSTELSREERAQMIRDLNAAEAKVLDKYGLSQREWARAQINRTREQADAVKQASKEQEAREKAAAEQAAKAQKDEGREVVVQKGFSDESPVVLEEKEGAQAVVEQGLPKDYESDQAAASEQDSLEKSGDAPAPKATGGKSGKR